MKLDKSQKDDLKSLTEHRGFKILEELVKEMEYSLLSKFKKVDLADEKVQIDLSNSQNMLAGAEYLIDTAKSSTKSIIKKEIK